MPKTQLQKIADLKANNKTIIRKKLLKDSIEEMFMSLK